ncbi:MAG TPA: MBL fold metallo-hydrolase [Mucilaginibacter sp.]|jgi:L-ascorbate metabolism protein UlaG (beta-lactamase superfamily)
MKNRYLWGGIVLLLLTTITGCGFVKSLGKNPEGEELARLKTLPNYRNASFQNLAKHPDTTAKYNHFLFIFRKRQMPTRPSSELPWVKTNLMTLAAAAPTIVWFGQSSLLIKTMQGTMLIDPVFSNQASPLPGVLKAFRGTKHYHAEDMPPIDVLIISHDHYDHLDYSTLKKLKDHIKIAVVPMGVGSHLVYWGFDPKKIIELNWNQSITLPGGLRITAAPAQHHSKRIFKGNKTLWASYVIQAGQYRLFFSGDSGYGSHFKQIGQQYGPFDLALVECGQYNQIYVHLGLGQPAQVAIDLHAPLLQPIHWAKFPEANHPWYEPIKTLLPAAEKLGIEVNVPRIGEPYTLGDPPKKADWWDFE